MTRKYFEQSLFAVRDVEFPLIRKQVQITAIVNMDLLL